LDDDGITGPLPVGPRGESSVGGEVSLRAPSGGGEGEVSSTDLNLDPHVPVDRLAITASVPKAPDPRGKRIREGKHEAEEEPSDKRARTVEVPRAHPVDPSPDSGEDSPSRGFNCDF
jgi:hypothetical protein